VCDVLNVVVVGTFKEERFYITNEEKRVPVFLPIFFQRTKIFFFFRGCPSVLLFAKGGKNNTLLSSKHTQKHTHTKRFYYTRFLWDDDDEFDH
jgi:Zn-dependent M28 family amino/carboxypeptidase